MKNCRRFILSRVLGLWGAMILVSFAHAARPLEQEFLNPPDAARPWVYWMWMDGNLSREGITADLEAMKKAGIGGVIIMEVDAGIPKGPVKFMSPEWRHLFKHVVAEVERLGLQMTLNAGPGWTGSGGPWVKPEQSMQHLVASTVEVAGPMQMNQVLPQPKRRPAFFGDGAMPEALEKAKNDFYRDVAVLAFPTPEPPSAITDIEEKALYIRAPYSSQPGVRTHFPSSASHPKTSSNAVIPLQSVRDVTSCLDATGRLAWQVPEGRWTILRLGRTSTGANTRPAPAPGLGLECDKLDARALDAHFDAFIGTLLREIGPRLKSSEAGWNMLHIDSWEMGAQNWTAAFRDEFKRYRGYDPLPYLPVVTGQVVSSIEVSERFLWDLRQTVQDLILDRHARHLKKLGRQHGFGLSIEPYDMTPCADMSLGSVADVPMCEFWLRGFNSTYSVLEATSIAHTCGRPIVAAESFTSDDSERWQDYPGSMKTLGDWAFCAGVNRVVFHRYQHQPWLDRWPGMTMGPYGVHWERTQTWWNMVGPFHTYLARCQHLLRQGLPVADVCFLVAEGAPQVFRPPPSATRRNPPDRLGYNFDGCAPEVLMDRMTVRKNLLTMPDGMAYRVLVLPDRETITPALLRKIKTLVKDGATVIGPPPAKSPSLRGYPACDDEVGRLARELWGQADGTNGQVHHVGKGCVVWQASQKFNKGDDVAACFANSRWIWYPSGTPASSAPVGRCAFHRTFMVENVAVLASARVLMTADNSFELWINGKYIGQGDNFHLQYAFDVAGSLRSGTNTIVVMASNGGDRPNPAGLAGALVMQSSAGQIQVVATDSAWLCSTNLPSTTSLGFLDAPATAMELGAVGMSPWGKPGTLTGELDQYGDYALVMDVLRGMEVLPDFESSGSLRYTHRRTATEDLYFVSNDRDQAVEAECKFRVSGRLPELWDPVTGRVRELPRFACREGQTFLNLRFEPAQSYFVVFRKHAGARPGTGCNFSKITREIELRGPWEVHFDPRWGGPDRVTFAALQDWSLRPEEGIKYYSGTAVYRQTFDWAGTGLADSEEGRKDQPATLWLDLGRVKNLARVRLNGAELGVLWCAPWRVDITRWARSGSNQLEIEVANLWPNRLIGDQSLPVDKRLTWTTWNPFNKDTPLLESGLLGPVRILFEVSSNRRLNGNSR